MKNIFKKAIAVILTISTLLTLCSCGAIGKTKIKVEDYIEITYDGFSGEAVCRIDVDYEGMNSLVDVKSRNKNLSNLAKEYDIDAQELIEELAEMRSWIYVSLAEDYENISNGDKLKVIVEVSSRISNIFGFTMDDVEEMLGVNFSGTEIEIEATGIKEYVTIDVFSAIEQYFSVDENAISGEGRLSIKIPEDFEVQIGGLTLKDGGDYSDVDFYEGDDYLVGADIVCDEKLTSGETYEVTLEYTGFYSHSLKYYGYLVESMTKTYTAPEFKYKKLSSRDELSTENIVYLKSLVTNIISSGTDGEQFVEMYYYETKDSSSSNKKAGIIAIVYRSEFYYTFSRYYTMIADNVVIDNAGNITAEFSLGDWAYDTLEETRSKGLNHDRYTYEKIA